jgi:hypothetical protein
MFLTWLVALLLAAGKPRPGGESQPESGARVRKVRGCWLPNVHAVADSRPGFDKPGSSSGPNGVGG